MSPVSEFSREYIPGTCNIGKEELKRRRNGAWFSVILTLITVVLIQGFTKNHAWRLLVFVPASSTAVSFLQWYLKFCVAFGILGVFNFGNLGKTYTVDQKENLKKDRAKAIQMIVIGSLIGAVIAVIYFLLPV